MLIQMKEIKTKTYPLDQGWFIDIVTTCKCYEAWIYYSEPWIYYRGLGKKELMFAVPKKQQTYDEFLNIVEANYEQYQVSYYEKI